MNAAKARHGDKIKIDLGICSVLINIKRLIKMRVPESFVGAGHRPSYSLSVEISEVTRKHLLVQFPLLMIGFF